MRYGRWIFCKWAKAVTKYLCWWKFKLKFLCSGSIEEPKQSDLHLYEYSILWAGPTAMQITDSFRNDLRVWLFKFLE
jgi:hypothetical protein